MRNVSMVTRNELLTVLVERYRRSERDEKQRILDEFVAVSGYHRKHAAPPYAGRSGRNRRCGSIAGVHLHTSISVRST